MTKIALLVVAVLVASGCTDGTRGAPSAPPPSVVIDGSAVAAPRGSAPAEATKPAPATPVTTPTSVPTPGQCDEMQRSWEFGSLTVLTVQPARPRPGDVITVGGRGLAPGTYQVLTSEIHGTEEGFFRGFTQPNYLVGTPLGSAVVRDDGVLSIQVKLRDQRSSTGCRYIWIADVTGLAPGQSSNRAPYSSPIWAE